MIGIQYIDSSNMRTFAERLEIFMNEHPEAEILFGQVKGTEGGKGVFAILSYDKSLELPIEKPAPKNNGKAEALAKARAAKAAKKAELEAKKAELEAELEAELVALEEE